MTRVNYQLYLRSEGWKATRRMMLVWAEHRCQICSSTGALQVHHNTYERLGEERPSDLTVLCDECHARHHHKLPTPEPIWTPGPVGPAVLEAVEACDYLPGWSDHEDPPAAPGRTPDTCRLRAARRAAA